MFRERFGTQLLRRTVMRGTGRRVLGTVRTGARLHLGRGSMMGISLRVLDLIMNRGRDDDGGVNGVGVGVLDGTGEETTRVIETGSESADIAGSVMNGTVIIGATDTGRVREITTGGDGGLIHEQVAGTEDAMTNTSDAERTGLAGKGKETQAALGDTEWK